MKTHYIGFGLGLFLLVVALILLAIFSYNQLFCKINEQKGRHKQYIGKTCVIGGDTLTIMDYSTWGETFILSNGQKIDFSLIENINNP